MAPTVRSCRRAGSATRLAGVVMLCALAAGCSLGGGSSAPTTSAPTTTTTAPVTTTTATTVPGPQTLGPRTVLSPIGLNVRKAPSRSSPVLGTASQGSVLTALGYRAVNGGWIRVKGATVTGWISAQPTLSAPGAFRSYASSLFGALYPSTWRVSGLPRSPSRLLGVAFRPASGPGDIVVIATRGVSQLPGGRPGYRFRRSSQVLVCGITASLVVSARAGTSATTSSATTSVPESLAYLAQVRFAVGKHHALGLYADLSDLGRPLQIFEEFVAALTFPAKVCTG